MSNCKGSFDRRKNLKKHLPFDFNICVPFQCLGKFLPYSQIPSARRIQDTTNSKYFTTTDLNKGIGGKINRNHSALDAVADRQQHFGLARLPQLACVGCCFSLFVLNDATKFVLCARAPGHV